MSIDEQMQKMLLDFKAQILSEMPEVIRKCLIPNLNTPPDAVTWLRPKEARELMGIKSRNSWKKLRQSGQVDFTKIGREFQYTKQSLLDYKAKRSTLRYKVSISSPKNKFYGKKGNKD